MDHVIDGMKPHYEVLLDWFVEEHKSGKYKKFSDNPFYEEVKALIDSMNILRKYLGWDPIGTNFVPNEKIVGLRKYLGWDPIRLKDEVKFYL